MTSTPGQQGERGQALVEFSLVLIPFLFILMGIFDLGRGIYVNNGVSQAARELARVTSVHPYGCNIWTTTCALGSSAETAGVVGTQRNLVPGLAGPGATITYTCTDVTDTTVSGRCLSGHFVKVTVQVPFSVITPLLGMVAPTTFSSTTHVQIP